MITFAPYLQVVPSALATVLDALDAGNDFVSTWRFPRVDPWLNQVQSNTFNWVTRTITGVPIHDLNCGFRGLRRSVARELTFHGDLFRFLPILANKQGFKVAEVKVPHMSEMGKRGFFGFGVSIRRFLDILTLFFLVKFTRKPLRFFGLIGAALFLVGLIINVYLLVEKLRGASLADRPLLLFGTLLLVLGFQTLKHGGSSERSSSISTHGRSVSTSSTKKSDRSRSTPEPEHSGKLELTSSAAARPLWVWFVLILCLAALLRFWAIDHGLPFSYYADEDHFVKRSIAFGSWDLNPHWFHKPAFFMYVLFFEYGIYFVVGKMMGWWGGATEFALHYFRDPGMFYLLGRITATLAGLGVVALGMRCGRHLAGRTCGLVGRVDSSHQLLSGGSGEVGEGRRAVHAAHLAGSVRSHPGDGIGAAPALLAGGAGDRHGDRHQVLRLRPGAVGLVGLLASPAA